MLRPFTKAITRIDITDAKLYTACEVLDVEWVGPDRLWRVRLFSGYKARRFIRYYPAQMILTVGDWVDVPTHVILEAT